MSLNSNKQNNIVVVVEDNENVALLISNKLNSAGFNTKIFNFGSAAVLYALSNPNSLLLIEYYMPDMTAKDIVQSIEGNRIIMPYLVMSEPGNEKAIIEMMKMGARDYLVKEKGFMDFLPTAINKVFEQIEVEDRLVSVEKSLRFSRDKFRHIFNSITDAIYIYDFEGNFLELNDAAYKRIGLDQKKNTNNLSYLNFQTDEFRQDFPRFIEYLSEKKHVRFESLEKDIQENRIPVECLARRILYGDEDAVLTISRDITENLRIKELLEQKERRFHRITNTISDYIVTVYIENNQAVKTVHSPACVRVTGYEPKELGEQNYLWLDMVHVRDKGLVLENVNKIINGVQVEPFEHRIIKKDGSIAWLRNTPVLHFDRHNEVISYDGVIQDITDQKKIEEKLLDQQTRLMATVNAFDGLVYICSPDYRINFANEKLIERTGYDPTGEFCYKAIHDKDQVCPWCRNQDDDNTQTMKWEVKSPKDNRWYSVVHMPIAQSDGTVSKQALVLDITDRKFADQELTKFNKLYYGLINELPIPVFRVRQDGVIVSANKAFYDLFHKNTDKDLNLWDILPELSITCAESKMLTLSNEKSEIEKETELEINEQKERKILKLKPIIDENEETVEYQGMFFDLPDVAK